VFICFSSCAHCLDFAYMFFLLHCFLVVLCWYSSTPPCYALSLFIDIPCLCFNNIRQHLLVAFLLVLICAPLLCFIGAHLCPIVVFYWCLLALPCCALVVFVSVSLLCFVNVCSHPPCYNMLVFIDTCLLHFVSLPCHPLLCFVDIHWRIFVLLCWCSSMPSWCVSIGACMHLFVVLCWYLSTPPCCALLVLISAPLLCSNIGVCWCLLVNIGVQVPL
jgi:hypothetical protein